jgi:hypothetical protein
MPCSMTHAAASVNNPTHHAAIITDATAASAPFQPVPNANSSAASCSMINVQAGNVDLVSQAVLLTRQPVRAADGEDLPDDLHVPNTGRVSAAAFRFVTLLTITQAVYSDNPFRSEDIQGWFTRSWTACAPLQSSTYR